MFIIAALIAVLLAAFVVCALANARSTETNSHHFKRHKGFQRTWRTVRKARLPDGFRRLWNFAFSPRVEFCNAEFNIGVHEGAITKKVDAAIATRHLLAKFGSDADHVNKCGASDIPLGPMNDEAEAAWQETLSQVGTLLVGLTPVLSHNEGSSGLRLVAGPLPDKAAAVDLCSKLDAVGIPCEPVPYAGTPVPLLN